MNDHMIKTPLAEYSETEFARFIQNSIIFAGLISLSYAAAHLVLECTLGFIFSLATVIFFIPPIYYFAQNRNFRASGVLVVLGAAFAVTTSALAVNMRAANEYYYFPCMMLALLIFDSRDKALIAFGTFLPGAVWLFFKVTGNPFENSPYLAPESFPYSGFAIVNFAGASAMTAGITFIYGRSLRRAAVIQQEIQHRLISTSKMVSMGELAGGLAHEINNPLGIIVARTQILKEKLNAITALQDSEKRACSDNLSKIAGTAEHITKIVRGLKDFSRTGDQDPPTTVDVKGLIDFSLELFSDRIEQNGISISVNCPEGTVITCREVQISQVLVNLLSNSIDAVEKIPLKWIKIDVSREKGTVMISVTDSGPGIKPQYLEKLMQPFFSTKEPGKGIGLGLSISKGIVDAHGGSLQYDERSPNTRFVIRFPTSI